MTEKSPIRYAVITGLNVESAWYDFGSRTAKKDSKPHRIGQIGIISPAYCEYFKDPEGNARKIIERKRTNMRDMLLKEGKITLEMSEGKREMIVDSELGENGIYTLIRHIGEDYGRGVKEMFYEHDPEMLPLISAGEGGFAIPVKEEEIKRLQGTREELVEVVLEEQKNIPDYLRRERKEIKKQIVGLELFEELNPWETFPEIPIEQICRKITEEDLRSLEAYHHAEEEHRRREAKNWNALQGKVLGFE